MSVSLPLHLNRSGLSFITNKTVQAANAIISKITTTIKAVLIFDFPPPLTLLYLELDGSVSGSVLSRLSIPLSMDKSLLYKSSYLIGPCHFMYSSPSSA